MAPVSLSSSISTMPTMKGGGEVGALLLSETSMGMLFPHMELVAISAKVTLPFSPETVFPSNSRLSTGQFSISAARAIMLFFSFSQAFTTAIPVT